MKVPLVSPLLMDLINTPDNFHGGKIFDARLQWNLLSSDKWFYDVVHGKFLAFVRVPIQGSPPAPLSLSLSDEKALDSAMLKFLEQRIVELCAPGGHGFLSNIFPTIKRDGTARVILNLKELNEYMDHIHFKMDTLKDVLPLIHQNCHFMSIDFKDAYFSVYVRPEDRNWFKFTWRNSTFRFTCLPQGLTSAPRIFTKLLKPVLSHLHKLGIFVSCYLDDCIFIADSADVLGSNVLYALHLFDSLGLTVNPHKSVLEPTQEIEFLGVVLNSVDMTATLTPRRRKHIKAQGSLLLNKDVISLLELSSFIGMAVASDPAVELAPLRYKYLEIIRNKELARHHGNYNSPVILDNHAQGLIKWWINNIDSQTKSLRSSPHQLELFCDASLTGWGAVVGNARTAGHWAHDELDHINCLELKAILMGLQSLCKDNWGTHIRLRSDSVTALTCLDRCGSTKLYLHVIVEQIFEWALSRGITLSTQHIQGLHNTEADKLSRLKNMDAEWMLLPHIFQSISQLYYTPDVDLFATRINTQLPAYVSWKPDPCAIHVNAFTMTWSNKNFYAFPPFSIISRVLQKLQEDEATVMVILPLWPTQVWFPTALRLLTAPPVLLPRLPLVLPQNPTLTHPRSQVLILTAMVLSGNRTKVAAFRRKLPDFCCTPGGRAREYSMGRILRNGCHFASAGKLISFSHLQLTF